MKTNFEQQIPQKSHLVDLWTRESKIVISMPSMKLPENEQRDPHLNFTLLDFAISGMK